MMASFNDYIEKRIKIYDCNSYHYKSIKSPKFEVLCTLPKISAREYLQNISAIERKLIICESKEELVDVLKDIYSKTCFNAEIYAEIKDFYPHCPNRDNIEQIIKLLTFDKIKK